MSLLPKKRQIITCFRCHNPDDHGVALHCNQAKINKIVVMYGNIQKSMFYKIFLRVMRNRSNFTISNRENITKYSTHKTRDTEKKYILWLSITEINYVGIKENNVLNCIHITCVQRINNYLLRKHHFLFLSLLHNFQFYYIL